MCILHWVLCLHELCFLLDCCLAAPLLFLRIFNHYSLVIVRFLLCVNFAISCHCVAKCVCGMPGYKFIKLIILPSRECVSFRLFFTRGKKNSFGMSFWFSFWFSISTVAPTVTERPFVTSPENVWHSQLYEQNVFMGKEGVEEKSESKQHIWAASSLPPPFSKVTGAISLTCSLEMLRSMLQFCTWQLIWIGYKTQSRAGEISLHFDFHFSWVALPWLNLLEEIYHLWVIHLLWEAKKGIKPSSLH